MRTQTPLVDIEALKAMLSPSESSSPYYYLDFEHINPVIPLFEGKKPFETVITQFSVHKSTVHPYHHERECDVNINKTDNINYIENATAAGTLVRYEYLCDGTSASLEELAVQLLEALGDTGTIYVYSSNEVTQFRRLASQYPHLAQKFENLEARLFDLERLIRRSIIHPHFFGRTSLKIVLPAMVPAYDGAYANLGVSDGASAIVAYERMLEPGTSNAERESITADLLEYCALDTLSLVELHRGLHKTIQEVEMGEGPFRVAEFQNFKKLKEEEWRVLEASISPAA